MISETKLDDLFPSAQFKSHGFRAPFRFDRNGEADGLPTKIFHLVSYFANRNVTLRQFKASLNPFERKEMVLQQII